MESKRKQATVLSDEEFYNRKKSDLKLIIIGDSAVGKTK